MRRRHHGDRHPVFENLVFALAALLALALLYLGATKLMAPRPASQGGVNQVLPVAGRPEKHELDVGPTERGIVRAAAPIKAKPPKRIRKTVVPAPK